MLPIDYSLLFQLFVSTACLAIFLLFSAGVYYFHVLPKWYVDHFHRQGIRGFPYKVLGQVKELADMESKDQLLEFYTSAAKEYGFTHTQSFGPISVLTVNDPELVKEVLRTHKDDYHKSSENMKETLRPLLGNGLLMSEGSFWKKQRKSLAKTFHFHNLKSMVELINVECVKVTGMWRERLQAMSDRGDPTHLEIHREVSCLTMDIIAVAAFGPSFLSDPEVNRSVHHAFGQVLQDLQDRATSGISLVPGIRHLPLASQRRVSKGCAAIQSEIRKVIQERRSGVNKSAVGGKDLLDLLLEAADAQDEKSRMSEEAIVDEAVTFVFAAFETTANMFSWLFVNLASNQDVWDRCTREVEEVVGDREPAFEDLKHLKVCEATMMETLRLYHPAPMISKYAIRDHMIGQKDSRIHIPKGAVVTVNTLLLHRNPQYWKDPETFNVDRFLGPADAIHPFAFIPFSEGQRSCLGKNFAMMESKLILCHILRNFRFLLVPGQKFVPTLQKLNLVPKYGVVLNVKDVTSSEQA